MVVLGRSWAGQGIPRPEEERNSTRNKGGSHAQDTPHASERAARTHAAQQDTTQAQERMALRCVRHRAYCSLALFSVEGGQASAIWNCTMV